MSDINKNVYKSVKSQAQAEYIEKKSRFIAYVKPVSEETEAIAFINEIKSKHWDARHNVYAYRIGSDGAMAQRYSDDGEPQGTAGIPVLDVILKNSLTNMVIVVTRYFGGILLGAAGLVRAYGKSASMGIEEAGIIQNILCDRFSVKIDYTYLSKMQRELPNIDCKIKEITYDDKVNMFILVPKEKEHIFQKSIIEFTNADVLVEKDGQEYIKVDI